MLVLQKDRLCLGMQNIVVYKVHNKFLCGPLLFEVVNNFKHVFLLNVGPIQRLEAKTYSIIIKELNRGAG